MTPPRQRMVTVMVVGPTTRCDVLYAKADYREFNRLVGPPNLPGVEGSISLLRIPTALRERGFGAYCDDEGVFHDSPPNHFAAQLGHWRLRGPVLFFKDTGDSYEHSLSPSDVQFLARYLASPPSEEARQWVADDKAFWAENPSGHSVTSFETIDDMFKALGLD